MKISMGIRMRGFLAGLAMAAFATMGATTLEAQANIKLHGHVQNAAGQAVKVGEVKKASPSGSQWETADATNFDSVLRAAGGVRRREGSDHREARVVDSPRSGIQQRGSGSISPRRDVVNSGRTRAGNRRRERTEAE